MWSFCSLWECKPFLYVCGIVSLFLMLFASDCCLYLGSLFSAAQTCTNLQAVALGTISICLTKPVWFSPWKRGSCRLAEISIEQFFSYLRRQSQNSQLTCRAYWHASARYSLHTSQAMNRELAADTCFLFQ